MTKADGLLKDVYENGAEIRTGSMEDLHCIYCNAWRDTDKDGKPYDEHTENCTYREIEDYLKSIGLISCP